MRFTSAYRKSAERMENLLLIIFWMFQLLVMGQGEGEGHGEGKGHGQGIPGIVWAILWFLILWLAAWPVGFFFAWWYVLFLPFVPCCGCAKDASDILLKLVQLPLTCSQNMMAQKAICWSWIRRRTMMPVAEDESTSVTSHDIADNVLEHRLSRFLSIVTF